MFPEVRAHWRVLFLDQFDVFVGELAIEQLGADVIAIREQLGLSDELVFETQIEADTLEEAIALIEGNARAAVIGLDFGGAPLEGGPAPEPFDQLPPDAFPPVPEDPFMGPPAPTPFQQSKQRFRPSSERTGLEPLLAHPWIRLQATPGISGALTATEWEPEPEQEPDAEVISPGHLRHGDACGNDDFFMDYVGAMFNGMTCEEDEKWHRVLVGGDAPDWAEGEMHIATDGRTVVAWDGKWWHKKKGEPCPAPNLRTQETRFYGVRPGLSGESGFDTKLLSVKVCRYGKNAKGAALGAAAWGNVKDCAKQKRRCVFVPFPFNIWDCYMANTPRCS